MKKIKFSGLILTKLGAVSQAGLCGPPDLDSWRACFDVWSNAMIMLDQLDLGPLQLYKNKVELLHGGFGEGRVWSLLYQSDTRARLEQLPRTKLELQQEHNEAVAAGKSAAYDPSRLRNHALHTVANDDRYRTHEFVEPALIVMSDARKAGSVVKDDAKVEKQDKKSAPAPEAARPAASPMPTAFNDGTCSNTVQGSWCGVNKDQAHQCSRCLGSRSVQKCPHSEAPAVGWVKDRQERGKGRGGRKGKGRRGNQY